jgi:hypothetical protein
MVLEVVQGIGIDVEKGSNSRDSKTTLSAQVFHTLVSRLDVLLRMSLCV